MKNPETAKLFASRIKSEGWNQGDAAEFFGVSRSTISQWARGAAALPTAAIEWIKGFVPPPPANIARINLGTARTVIDATTGKRKANPLYARRHTIAQSLRCVGTTQTKHHADAEAVAKATNADGVRIFPTAEIKQARKLWRIWVK